jgi:hypothetical protein
MSAVMSRERVEMERGWMRRIGVSAGGLGVAVTQSLESSDEWSNHIRLRQSIEAERRGATDERKHVTKIEATPIGRNRLPDTDVDRRSSPKSSRKLEIVVEGQYDDKIEERLLIEGNPRRRRIAPTIKKPPWKPCEQRNSHSHQEGYITWDIQDQDHFEMYYQRSWSFA